MEKYGSCATNGTDGGRSAVIAKVELDEESACAWASLGAANGATDATKASKRRVEQMETCFIMKVNCRRQIKRQDIGTTNKKTA